MLRRVVPLAFAGVSVLVALFALDRVVAYLDLGYAAARGRPLEERRLVREEFDVPVRLNALGFRESRLPGPKPAHTVRIVAVGDSFTQGFGVEADAAWPALVERQLDTEDLGRRYEVVNLGVPGTNPRDYLANLEDPGLAYAPDVVVVMVMANDVQDRWVQRRFGVQFGSGVLVEARRAVLSPRSAWASLPDRVFPALYPFLWARVQALRSSSGRTAHAAEAPAAAPSPARPAAVGSAEAVLHELGARFGRADEVDARVAAMSPEELDALRPVLLGTVGLEDPAAADPYLRVMAIAAPRLFADAVLLPPAYDDAWDDVAAQLERTIAVARGAGARVVLAFAPAIQQVTPAARPQLERLGFVWDARTLTDRTLADRLAGVAARAGVPFVDLLPVMRARRDERLYFPRDGHWTPAGHALVAATLVDTLRGATREARP